MSRIILIASGKGGVGKSSLSAALAVTLARRGMRTLLIDADVGLRCLDLMLGMQDRVLYELSDCMTRRCTLDDALITHPDYPLLQLMVGGQDARPKDFDIMDLQRVMNTLSRRFDVILIDSPAGLGRGLKNFLGLAHQYVLVATPDAVCLRDTEKTAKMLMDRGLSRPSLLLNRYDGVLARRLKLGTPGDLALSLDLELMGTIPESQEVYHLQQEGKTMADAKDDRMRQAVEQAADSLMGIAKAPDTAPKLTWRERLRALFGD